MITPLQVQEQQLVPSLKSPLAKPLSPVNASGDFRVNGLILSGGTFTAPSGTLTIARDWWVGEGNLVTHDMFKVDSGSTFNGSTTSLFFSHYVYGYHSMKANLTINAAVTVEDITFHGTNNSTFNYVNYTLSGANAIKVTDTATFTTNSGGRGIRLNGGYLDVEGNVVASEGFYSGSSIVRFVGGGSHTYDYTSGTFPFLELSDGGTLAAESGTTDLRVSGFIQSSGAFTAPSQNMTIANPLYSTNVKVMDISGGTFNHNNGTVIFYTSLWSNGTTYTTTIDVNTTLALNDLTFNGGNSHGNSPPVQFQVTAGDTITVAGDLSVESVNNAVKLINGVIQVTGNISCEAGTVAGTTDIQLVGSGSHTYTFTGGSLPTLTVTGGGTVTPAEGTTSLQVSKFVQDSGSFTAPSGTMTINAGVRANVTLMDISGGTFIHNDGTLRAYAQYWSNNSTSYTYTLDVDTSLALNNLSFYGGNSHSTAGSQIRMHIASGDTLNVAGNLSLDTGGFRKLRVNSGAINVSGDVTVDNNFDGGSTALTFTGTNNQAVTHSGGTLPTGAVIINKASGTVFFGNKYKLEFVRPRFNGNFWNS